MNNLLVSPVGSGSVYIIHDTAKEIGFDPYSDECLKQLFPQANLLFDACRFNFVNPFRVDVPDADLENAKSELFNDIDANKPKIIICLGKNAINLFEKVKTHGDARKVKFSYKGVPVYTTWGINYVKYCRRSPKPFDQSIVKQFVSDIDLYIHSSKFEDESAKFNKNLYEVINPSEASKLLEIFKNDNLIILDYETNSLDARGDNSIVCSIGLWGHESSRGVYVNIKSLEQPFAGYGDIESLREFFKQKRFIVFNVQFEQHWTQAIFGVRLNEPIDVLGYSRGLLEPGGLKEVSSRRLGMLEWDDVIDRYITNMNTIVSSMTGLVKTRPEQLWIQENLDAVKFGLIGFDAFCDYIHNAFLLQLKNKIEHTKDLANSSDTSGLGKYNILTEFFWKEHSSIDVSPDFLIEKYGLEDLYSEVSTKKQFRFYMAAKEIQDILSKNYINEYQKQSYNLLNLILNKVKDNAEVNYSDIPYDILSFYCMQDVFQTSRLYDNLIAEIKEKNLEEAMEIMQENMRLSAELEINGIGWNDEYAILCKKHYDEYETRYLKKFLLLPLVEPCVLEARYLLKRDENSKYIEGRKKISDDEKEALHRQVKSLNRNKYNQQELIEINSTLDVDVLHNYFNPDSSSKRSVKVFSNAIMTHRVKMAHYMQACKIKIDFSSLDDFKKIFPASYDIYKDWLVAEETGQEGVLKFLETLNIPSTSSNRKSEYKFLEECRNFEIGSFDEKEFIQPLYTLFGDYLKVDTNAAVSATEEDYGNDEYDFTETVDKTTWIDEWYVLYYFRISKKVSKARSAFIEGSVGRKNVEIVSNFDVYKQVIPYLHKYYDEEGEPHLADYSESYVKRTNFRPLSTETRRWRSGEHLLPPTLKDLTKSRYPDGIKIYSDFKNQEIRILAGVAGDESLIEAFKRDADIHKYMTAIRLNKPENDTWEFTLEDGQVVKTTDKEKAEKAINSGEWIDTKSSSYKSWKKLDGVTKHERSVGKSCTFLILYGGDENSLAAREFAGDINKAKNVFTEFYAAFPKIKDYIKESHRMALTDGKVKTFFGDELIVGMPQWALQLSDKDKEMIINNPDWREWLETEYTPAIKALEAKLSRDGWNKDTGAKLKELRYKHKNKLRELRNGLKHAQNFRIQSSSSELVGSIMWKIVRELHKTAPTVKADSFIHDSMTFDVQMKDVLKTMLTMKKICVQDVREKWPEMWVDTDMDLCIDGCGKKSVIEMLSWNVEGDKLFVKKAECVDIALEKFLAKCEKTNVVITNLHKKEKEKIKVELSEMWQQKTVFPVDIGKEYTKYEISFDADFSNVLDFSTLI